MQMSIFYGLSLNKNRTLKKTFKSINKGFVINEGYFNKSRRCNLYFTPRICLVNSINTYLVIRLKIRIVGKGVGLFSLKCILFGFTKLNLRMICIYTSEIFNPVFEFKITI